MACRQVFAVLSLPAAVEDTVYLQVAVRTYWRKYNRATNVVGDIIPGSENTPKYPFPQVIVPSRANVDEALAAKITRVLPFDIGNGQILVHVYGDNFLPGTTVTLGNTVYKEAGTLAAPGDSPATVVGKLHINST